MLHFRAALAAIKDDLRLLAQSHRLQLHAVRHRNAPGRREQSTPMDDSPECRSVRGLESWMDACPRRSGSELRPSFGPGGGETSVGVPPLRTDVPPMKSASPIAC